MAWSENTPKSGDKVEQKNEVRESNLTKNSSGPQSEWLRYIFPDQAAPSTDEGARSALQALLQGRIDALAESLMETIHNDRSAAQFHATNLVMNEILCIQRTDAIEGYRTMVNTLFWADPELVEARNEMVRVFAEKRRAAEKKSLRIGTAIGAALMGAAACVFHFI